MAALLARHRMVTVTGPGGSGKTRLAIEVARGVVSRFEDGVWLVEQAQIEHPGLVPTAAAIALGVREQPGLSLAESLAAVIGGRHVLLVLDNCEHVIDAAAGLCDGLLRVGDDLRVLATGREPLGWRGRSGSAAATAGAGRRDAGGACGMRVRRAFRRPCRPG